MKLALSKMKLPRSNYAHRLQEVSDVVLSAEAATAKRGRWRDFFRQRIGAEVFEGRVVLEIGCFDAGFLQRIAQQHPRTAFIGIDWKAKPLHDGARRVAENQRRNVVLLRVRAQDARAIFGDGELDEIWIFHPDPFAASHEFRQRLMNPAFLTDAHALLRDASSTLTLKTDHAGYYQWTMALFGLPKPEWVAAGDLPACDSALIEQFSVTATSSDFWNDPAARAHTQTRLFSGEMTSFETRFVRKRLPIYFVELRKR